MIFDADLLLLHLRLVGGIMAGLVLVNAYIPCRYRWREEMAALSLLNRQIFQAHAVFLVLTLALLAIMLLAWPDVLLEPTRASRALLFGLTVFWGLRILMQWWFYSPAVWRGHRFNTAMHYLFSAVWVYTTSVFAAALWRSLTVSLPGH